MSNKKSFSAARHFVTVCSNENSPGVLQNVKNILPPVGPKFPFSLFVLYSLFCAIYNNSIIECKYKYFIMNYGVWLCFWFFYHGYHGYLKALWSLSWAQPFYPMFPFP
jgi:hypothetical protein